MKGFRKHHPEALYFVQNYIPLGGGGSTFYLLHRRGKEKTIYVTRLSRDIKG